MLKFLGLGKVQLVVIAVAATVIGLLYWQNQGLRGDLATAQENNGKLTTAVETQKTTIAEARKTVEQWQAAHSALLKRIEELSNVQRAATSETRRLADIFSKHDLAALARAKPGLIERRINTGTGDALSVLERITAGDLLNSAAAREAARKATAPQPGKANP